MTYEEAIDWLKLDIEMTQFDPMTGKYQQPNWEALQVIKAQEKAIEALKKQIPKKPTDKKFLGMSGFHIGYCPTCKSPINEELAYCDACGQEIEWNIEIVKAGGK